MILSLQWPKWQKLGGNKKLVKLLSKNLDYKNIDLMFASKSMMIITSVIISFLFQFLPDDGFGLVTA